MKLHLIVAHDESLLIGAKGKLPWHIPEDMAHFRRVTMGHPILMGRGVFEELGCKPLPGRRNIVLSSKVWPGIESYPSIPQALQVLQDESVVFVIGGGQIYAQLIHLCHIMYVTAIDGEHQGDVWFPEYRHEIGHEWLEISRDNHPGFSFIEYENARFLA